MRIDPKTYAIKHINHARHAGVRTAAHSAVAEAYHVAKAKGLRPWYRRKEDLIWNTEWDICLVLDATRFDLLLEALVHYDWLGHVDMPGWSVGSASPEWYALTFDPKAVPPEQVGVVTANPFAAKPAYKVKSLANTPLHQNPSVDEVNYVFQDHWGCDIDDNYLDVTHPAVVTDQAYTAIADWQVDRLVVHYMQPHIPFRSRADWFGKRENLQHFGEPEFHRKTGPYQQPGNEIWKQLRDGERDYDEVWEAYLDNLYWVLDEVDRLRQAVDARILITSDHGNALGEGGLWSHPPNKQIPALREVPWVIIDGLGPAELEEVEYTSYSVDNRPIDDQLKALGYME